MIYSDLKTASDLNAVKFFHDSNFARVAGMLVEEMVSQTEAVRCEDCLETLMLALIVMKVTHGVHGDLAVWTHFQIVLVENVLLAGKAGKPESILRYLPEETQE